MGHFGHVGATYSRELRGRSWCGRGGRGPSAARNALAYTKIMGGATGRFQDARPTAEKLIDAGSKGGQA
jgi:hypothetical protein